MAGLQNITRWLDKIFSIDWYQVRIIPAGARDPLPSLPLEVEITPADVERAIEEWDELMPEYSGMLEAGVVNQRDFDDG